MANLDQWSPTAADNADAVPDGAPEGHQRTSVNDITREMMAASRRQWGVGAWFARTKGPVGKGYTLSKLSDTQVNLVHESTPTDASSLFTVGARVRVGDGSTYVVGYVTAAVYASPTTTVTINFDGAGVVQATPTTLDTHITDTTLGKTAFSPRGTTLAQDPPEVPAIDDLGDGATLDQGSGNSFDADLLDGLHAADIIAASTGVGIHVLNGNFAIAQRGLVIDDTTYFPNDNSKYVVDQWVLLMGDLTGRPGAGSGVVDVSIVDALGSDGIPASTAVRLTGNSNVGVAPTEKVGLIQWLPNDAIRHLKSGTVSLSGYVRKPPGSNFENFRMAIVEWTGTADTLTSTDPINDWNTAGFLPTVKASYIIAVSDTFTIGTDWTQYKLENVSISSGMKNLGILLYVDDTSWGIGDAVEFSGIDLTLGALAGTYQEPDFADTLHRCQRFFVTTFDHGAVIAEFSGQEASALRTISDASFGTLIWEFGTSMFKTPTVTTLNPGAAGSVAGYFFCDTDDADYGAATISAAKRRVHLSGAAGGHNNHVIDIHAIAEALL